MKTAKNSHYTIVVQSNFNKKLKQNYEIKEKMGKS